MKPRFQKAMERRTTQSLCLLAWGCLVLAGCSPSADSLGQRYTQAFAAAPPQIRTA